MCTSIVCFVSSADVDSIYAEGGDLHYLSCPMDKKSFPDHIQGPILYTVPAPALRYGHTGK